MDMKLIVAFQRPPERTDSFGTFNLVFEFSQRFDAQTEHWTPSNPDAVPSTIIDFDRPIAVSERVATRYI